MTEHEVASRQEPRPGSMSPDSIQRWAVEFVVIVVGVLVALAADAAWSDRQERTEEREALVQLLGDFQANDSQLEAFREFQVTALTASRELLALGGRLGASGIDREASELLVEAVEIRTLDPVNGTLNSILESGKLGILRSDSLRSALAEWPSNIEDLAVNERWIAEYWFNRMWPYLAERGVWLDALTTSGRLDPGEIPPTAPYLDEIVGDPFFQELLAQRISSLQYMLADVDMVANRIDRIVRLIEAN